MFLKSFVCNHYSFLLFFGFKTDFSLALLGAMSLVMNRCTVLEYLNGLWEFMVNQENARLCALHVCRFHFLKAVKGKVRDLLGNNLKEERVTLMRWVQKFVRGRDLCSFLNCVLHISHLCAFKYENKQVVEAYTKLLLPAENDGK